MNLPRGIRWAVPAGLVTAVGGVLAASVISAAAAAPPLPPHTPAQLLAAVAGRASVPPMTGTVVETASLGLPALPPVVGTVSLPSLLAGSHTISIWYAGPAHYRLALPQSMSESDLVRNGRNVWLWGSSANVVTHVMLPAGRAASRLPSLPLTPLQAAGQVLTEAGPATTVAVDSNVTVAGQAAYQLSLAPKSPGSLIGQVRLAVDARYDVPLRVQVFAKGAASPAFQIGFTAISFGKPAAANFAFRPPAGTAVVEDNIGSKPGSRAAGTALGSALTTGLTVIGHDWLTVADLPESWLSALTGTAPSAKPATSGGTVVRPFGHSSATAGPAPSAPGMAGLGIGADVIVNALLQSAKHVSGSWGSGRLLRTSLVTVLITSNGRVLAGAVTPGILYQAATQAGHTLAGLQHHTASQASPR